MLDKLTEEQIKMMDIVKNEYIHLLERKSNDKDIIEGIRLIYKISGFREPDIKIFDSPLACQLYLNKLCLDMPGRMPLQITSRIEHQVRREMLWNTVQCIDPKILCYVEEILGSEVSRQIENLVRSPVFLQVDRRVRREIELQVGMQQMISYLQIEIDHTLSHVKLPSYDYLDRIGLIKSNVPDEYKKYFRSGIFSCTYLEGLAVVSRNPLRLSRDDRGRLHSQEGYAIEWADGYGQNFVHGVFFELELFDKIFIKKNITGKEIFDLNNVEQKAVAIQSFGYDKLIDELGARKIDSYMVKNEYTGVESVSELYDFEIEHREGEWRRTVIRGRFVKVQDHSTGKITVLGVPIIRETETAKGAIAWTFQLNENEYGLSVET